MTEAQPYSFETVDIASAALGLSRRVTIWIPGAARSSSRTPVLYLNDGQNLFDAARAYAGVTWRVAETAAWLVERHLIPPIIIVGIDHRPCAALFLAVILVAPTAADGEMCAGECQTGSRRMSKAQRGREQAIADAERERAERIERDAGWPRRRPG